MSRLCASVFAAISPEDTQRLPISDLRSILICVDQAVGMTEAR
jgi:hypothetical protein